VILFIWLGMPSCKKGPYAKRPGDGELAAMITLMEMNSTLDCPGRACYSTLDELARSFSDDVRGYYNKAQNGGYQFKMVLTTTGYLLLAEPEDPSKKLRTFFSDESHKIRWAYLTRRLRDTNDWMVARNFSVLVTPNDRHWILVTRGGLNDECCS
jgi:hypothetical protein